MAGAISGQLLGEAAHRLIKNTLQFKPNSSPGLLNYPHRNGPASVKARPAGPSGVDGRFQYPNPNPNPWGAPNFRAAAPPVAMQSSRTVERYGGHDFYAGAEMSSLAIAEQRGPRPQSLPLQVQGNAGFWPNQPPVQSAGPPPPRPPVNWIGQQPGGHPVGMSFSRPEIANYGAYARQQPQMLQQQQQEMRKVYQPKLRPPHRQEDYSQFQ